MRTGLKHLCGVFATLLLLLTIILWVDSNYAFITFTVAVPQTGINIRSGEAQIDIGFDLPFTADEMSLKPDLSLHRETDFDALRFFRIIALNPPGDVFFVSIEDIQQSLPEPPIPMFGSSSYQGVYSFIFPHWLPALLFSLPTFLYLRFLIRRRRTARAPSEPST